MRMLYNMNWAISNTSPLLFLYRIRTIEWLAGLFDEVWGPTAVYRELEEGQRRGYDVPDLTRYSWLIRIDPTTTPAEWLSLDLGNGTPFSSYAAC